MTADCHTGLMVSPGESSEEERELQLVLGPVTHSRDCAAHHTGPGTFSRVFLSRLKGRLKQPRIPAITQLIVIVSCKLE